MTGAVKQNLSFKTNLPSPEVRKTAVISECGLYRYRLDRTWSKDPQMGFIMLNPSIADGDQDDPTVRRCISFAHRENCGGIVVVNLFPYRATKPAALWATSTETARGGPRSEIELAGALSCASIIVAAWGADTRDAERSIVERYGSRLVCLGKTKSGQPRHPLYVRGNAPIIPL